MIFKCRHTIGLYENDSEERRNTIKEHKDTRQNVIYFCKQTQTDSEFQVKVSKSY